MLLTAIAIPEWLTICSTISIGSSTMLTAVVGVGRHVQAVISWCESRLRDTSQQVELKKKNSNVNIAS